MCYKKQQEQNKTINSNKNRSCSSDRSLIRHNQINYYLFNNFQWESSPFTVRLSLEVGSEREFSQSRWVWAGKAIFIGLRDLNLNRGSWRPLCPAGRWDTDQKHINRLTRQSVTTGQHWAQFALLFEIIFKSRLRLRQEWKWIGNYLHATKKIK